MNEIQVISKKIMSLPGRPLFMLDRDVAELYETETRIVNQAVKRNPERFPEDFVFQLTAEETKKVITICDKPDAIKFRPDFPYAFTREGCNMLSAVLNTPIAIQRSVQIMRAFTALERFVECKRESRFTNDAPDSPLLPSGLQLQMLMKIYGKEETKLILQEYFGIYPGRNRDFITPTEAKIIQKNNPNKRRRDEVIGYLREKGIPVHIICAVSGLGEKTVRNIHKKYLLKKFKEYEVNNATSYGCHKKYADIKDKAVMLYSEGVKPKEISERLNVPLSTVYSWIK